MSAGEIMEILRDLDPGSVAAAGASYSAAASELEALAERIAQRTRTLSEHWDGTAADAAQAWMRHSREQALNAAARAKRTGGPYLAGQRGPARIPLAARSGGPAGRARRGIPLPGRARRPAHPRRGRPLIPFTGTASAYRRASSPHRAPRSRSRRGASPWSRDTSPANLVMSIICASLFRGAARVPLRSRRARCASASTAGCRASGSWPVRAG